MKIKCILRSFFKNMWNDIYKEFEKPFDWTPVLVWIFIIILVFGGNLLWEKYKEMIKLILSYSCIGLVAIFWFLQIGAMFYYGCKWIKKSYDKSKEECK